MQSINIIDHTLETIFKQISLDNVNLNHASPISAQFLDIGIDNLYVAIQYVNNLHYAPPSEKFNWQLVLAEKCGTCSTKHSLLVKLAKENNVKFALGIGIYKMSGVNYPVMKDLLADAGLPYIPESHNFIVYNDAFLDVTFPHAATILEHNEIEQLQIIDASELVNIKTNLYPKYLQQWLQEHKPDMNLDSYAILHKKIVDTLGQKYV